MAGSDNVDESIEGSGVNEEVTFSYLRWQADDMIEGIGHTLSPDSQTQSPNLSPSPSLKLSNSPHEEGGDVRIP